MNQKKNIFLHLTLSLLISILGIKGLIYGLKKLDKKMEEK